MWEMASLPFASGGLCLRNAERLPSTACWSWARTLPVIILTLLTFVSFSRGVGGFHLEAATECRDRLDAASVGAMWIEGSGEGSTQMTSSPRFHAGWQSVTSSTVEDTFSCSAVWPRLGPTEQALVLSQHWPMAWIPLHCFPTSSASRLDPRSVFASSTCVASGVRFSFRPLAAGVASHLACATSGVLGRRGSPLERCDARICRSWREGVHQPRPLPSRPVG